MKNLTVFLLVAMMSISMAFSQSLSPSVITQGGEFVKQAGYSLSYTVGEMMIETYYSDHHILTQGFQQPFYKNLVEEEETLDPVWAGYVYPNPVWNTLNVGIEPLEGSSYQIELVSTLGKRITVPYELNTDGGLIKYRVNLDGLSAGIYFLRILPSDGEQKAQTFKINKIN